VLTQHYRLNHAVQITPNSLTTTNKNSLNTISPNFTKANQFLMEFSLDTNPIITQFRPREGQWELTEDNINRVDPDTKQTILHNYCQYIDSTPLEVFEYLIKIKGCDINLQDGDNDTPVHIAFWRIQPNDDINILTYFLHLNDINVNIRGQYGFTLLHCVCTNINTLQLETFKYLIEIKGADINVQDDRNQTPLH
jgi:ankyrin repeat protein